MSLVKDIKTILVQNSISAELIYLSYIPEQDELITISQSGGRGRNKGDGIEEPTFQVFVRSLDYEVAIERIESIRDILDTVSSATISNSTYLAFYETSGILELGIDIRGRYEFSINFRTYKEKITAK